MVQSISNLMVIDFPLNGKTDVVVAMQNNCSQSLVILGAYHNKNQRDGLHKGK